MYNDYSQEIIDEIKQYTMLEDWINELSPQMEDSFREAINLAVNKKVNN